MNSKERKELRYQRRKTNRENKKNEKFKREHDFDDVFSFENIYDSFDKCRRGVAWKSAVKVYDVNRLKYSYNTFRDIHSDRYKFKGFDKFSIHERGKIRYISSIHISDRVVQRTLCKSFVPVFSSSFIYDNHASLKGHGTAKALDRFKCILDRHYRKYGTDGYALLIDARSYFKNLNKDIVKSNVSTEYLDERFSKLSNVYIDSEECGLSLGSETNQIYAVGYQNKIDHYAKEKLRLDYLRYMDDTVILNPSKEYLTYCLNELKKLYKKYGIIISPNKTQIVKISKGIKFLKVMHYLTPTGKIIRKPWKRSIVTMRRKLKKYRRMVDNCVLTLQDVTTSYNSWKGYISKFDSYRTVKNMDKLFYDLFPELKKEKQKCIR